MSRRLSVCILALLILAIPSPAHARDQGEIRIGPSQPALVKDYPSFPLASGVVVGSARTPAACRTSLNCDTIVLVIDAPRTQFFVASIALFFEGAPGNDMHLYLHEGEDNDKDGTQDETIASSASLREMPERIDIEAAGRYQLVVLNRAGSGPPYRIRAEFKESEIPPVPPSTRNRSSSSELFSTSPAVADYSPLPPPLPLTQASPVTVRQREVETYGDDSAPVAMRLKTLGSSDQGDSAESSSILPVVALIFLLAGAGVAGYLRFWRPRRTQE